MTAISIDASLQIGTLSVEDSKSSQGIVAWANFDTRRPLPLKNTTSLIDLAKEYSQDERKAELISAARARAANILYKDENTLKAIRMRAGLSQSELAERANTTQPHVANIEKGKVDPCTGLITRIASAIGIEPVVVFNAICNHK